MWGHNYNMLTIQTRFATCEENKHWMSHTLASNLNSQPQMCVSLTIFYLFFFFLSGVCAAFDTISRENSRQIGLPFAVFFVFVCACVLFSLARKTKHTSACYFFALYLAAFTRNGFNRHTHVTRPKCRHSQTPHTRTRTRTPEQATSDTVAKQNQQKKTQKKKTNAAEERKKKRMHCTAMVCPHLRVVSHVLPLPACPGIIARRQMTEQQQDRPVATPSPPLRGCAHESSAVRFAFSPALFCYFVYSVSHSRGRLCGAQRGFFSHEDTHTHTHGRTHKTTAQR